MLLKVVVHKLYVCYSFVLVYALGDVLYFGVELCQMMSDMLCRWVFNKSLDGHFNIGFTWLELSPDGFYVKRKNVLPLSSKGALY